MRRKKWFFLILVVPVALGLIPTVPHPFLQLLMWWVPIPPRVDVPEPREGVERVLVIAPHPDDEVLGAGGAIAQFISGGHQVLVVFITNGDANTAAKRFFTWNPLNRAEDYRSLGYRRMKEAARATSILGVRADHLLFLGYPDQGLLYLWTTNMAKGAPYNSPYTQADHPFYLNSFNPEASYTGEDLLGDLITIVSQYRPTVVYVPHPKDGHPDHYASARFAEEALAAVPIDPEVRYYLVHAASWPSPSHLIPDARLLPPLDLVEFWEWKELDLSEEIVELKLEAVRAYSSQRLTNGRFLASFVRENELYAINLLETSPAR